jgi:hypothetical protein
MFKQKVTCAIVLMSIIVAVTCASTPVSAANYKNIGVTAGVVNTYQYNSTATPTATKFTVYFESVVGTNATIVGTLYKASGNVISSSSKTGNISLHTSIYEQNLQPYVVAANLNGGDNVTYGSLRTFNSSSDMSVAGTTRSVLNLNYKYTGVRTDFYYDRATGITVKANIFEGGSSWENITLISTTAWSAGTQSSSSTLLLAGIGIGGLVVGLAIGLVVGRRKKGK